MGIKEVLKNYGEKRKRLKEYEDELRIRKTAEERMKSSNERDLEEHIEKDRQERIKQQLSMYKERDMKRFWASPYKQNIKPQKNGISLKSGLLGGKCL
jgi:hypothetical protein